MRFWGDTYATASTQASRVDNGNTVPWYQVKRLTYELQDLADIVPTHWQYNPWYIHWLSSDSVNILLESPVMGEAGQLEVSAGLQRFYARSRDVGASGLTDGREGIISKNWFPRGSQRILRLAWLLLVATRLLRAFGRHH